MPEHAPKALQGLRSLGQIPAAEYADFIEKNKDLIEQHSYDPGYINSLYQNGLYIKKYGIDKFKATPGVDNRMAEYRSDIINTEFRKLYSPFKADGTRDNSKGLGEAWEMYGQMSDDFKLKLMESKYLSPAEFKAKWDKHMQYIEDSNKEAPYFNSNIGAIRLQNPQSAVSTGDYSLTGLIKAFWQGGEEGKRYMQEKGKYFMADALKAFWQSEEAGKRYLQEYNQKILEDIYRENADEVANSKTKEVSYAYNDPLISQTSDQQLYDLFIKEIVHNSYINKDGRPNLGIPTWEAYFYQNGKVNVRDEVKNLSIQEMREILAKKRAYEATMSPIMARTALDNDARRYVKAHQGKLARLGLFARDVSITGMAYSADKVNGFAEMVRMGQDGLANAGVIDKPVVWVDDASNIVDMNKVKSFKTKNGKMAYKDENGQVHYLHQEQVDYTTLHSMGKNTDGSDITGAFGIDFLTLNPQYWSRAEQFGTLDVDLQKQYEEIGVSPYKIAYDPNEDSSVVYEGFKMMTFGGADVLSQVLPYGIGKLGKYTQEVNKASKALRGLGKTMELTGTFLNHPKVMGTMGALGIAYAYERGAFQETLAQNAAKIEEEASVNAHNNVYNRYNTDKEYKARMDTLIAATFAQMKKQYMAQIAKDSDTRIVDEKKIDEMLKAKAQETVLAQEVEEELGNIKASKEYADKQQRGIQEAGDAAINTFWPEAIKYGLVNNLGHRKILYTNGSGATRRVSSALEGLKEITTKDGLKRMGTETSKFLTRGDKWKEYGKTAVSQMWGGLWTNGTDDMMVDAAERMSEDSYNRYLQAYNNGDATAATYGIIDGVYSYMQGLGNSLGQESTMNSAIVGAVGSAISTNLHFVNLASLATKKGREAYKNTVLREVVRDEDGKPIKNEDGSLKYKEYGKMAKFRNNVNFFIQNGIINSYYAKKMAEKDLQNHADFVNKILDDHDDFQDIEQLMAVNLASDEYSNPGDEKTMKFLNALYSMKVLRNIGNKSNDPTSLSSVVQKAKGLIDQISRLEETGEEGLTEEGKKNLLAQYYAKNPGIPQSEETAAEAIKTMVKNARTLQEADAALDIAEQRIKNAEKSRGEAIDPQVKTRLMINSALNRQWEERVEKMKSEIGDSSSESSTTDPSVMIAAVGGRENAKALRTVYEKQRRELTEEHIKALEEADKAKKELEEAHKNTLSKKEGTAERIEAEKKEKELKDKYDNATQEVRFKEALISATDEKTRALQETISEDNTDEVSQTNSAAQEEYNKAEAKLSAAKAKKQGYLDAKGRVKKGHNKQVEKLNKQIDALEKTLKEKRVELNKSADRILTADEILSLDPVTRAKMMDKVNRNLYSKEQQTEIEKLEKQLLSKDADALQKIQDISLLTQRIKANEDAYFRMIENPEAAAYALEIEHERAANSAYNLINQRCAESFANVVNQLDENLKSHPDATEKEKKEAVYNELKLIRADVLDILEKDGLLPNYLKEISDAKEWRKLVSDIDAVIENSDRGDDEKQMLSDNAARVIKNAKDKDEAIAKLEKVIDDLDKDNPVAAKDFEDILKGLEALGYQRDATVIENREKRRAREKREAEEREKKRKQAEAEAKAAAEKKVKEEEEKGNTSSDAEASYNAQQAENAQPLSEVPANGEGVLTPAPEDAIDQDASKAELKKKVPGVWAADLLMEEEMEGTSFKLGEMWKTGGTPTKDAFTIGREGNTISWKIGDDTTTLSIESSQYETDTDHNETFLAKSMEKKDDGWYFNGHYEGSKESTQVKAKEGFSLDEAIENEKKAREALATAEGVNTDNKNLIVEEDTVTGKSETIEEQSEDATSNNDAGVQVSDVFIDSDDVNTKSQNSDSPNLTGNPMYLYDSNALHVNGILVRRVGNRGANDTLNSYNAWLNAAGVKLQNIIDRELGQIVKANPHAKVKFMVIRSDKNATNDFDMSGHCMLVLDYDNDVNKGITTIHDDSNGGVIESNGKKYLIIGTLGYGDRNANKLPFYDIIWGNNPHSEHGYGIMRGAKRKQFFDSHPKERFYVNEEISTEIVPGYPIPGWIVRQTEKDTSTSYRSVGELLDKANKDRNPFNFTWDTLAWGIQEYSKYATVNTEGREVMVPKNKLANAGRAFVLIPASNGKLIPSYLKPLMYKEIRDGALKKKIDRALEDVTSFDAQTRVRGIIALSNIFYFNSKTGDSIISRKSRAEIALVHDGKVFGEPFDLNNFDRAKFLEAFEALNPRVNITLTVLRNKELLKEYDEAGALTTDAALLATAGSGFEIYPIDSEGKMVIPKAPVHNPTKATNNSDYRNTNRNQIPYKGNYYIEAKGTFYLNSLPVSDAKTLKDLQYNKKILDNQLIPEKKDGVWEYYIMSSGEHPEVIKVHKNTKEVVVASEQQAKEFVEKVIKEKEEKAREEKAKEAMEEALKNKEASVKNVPLEDGLQINPETGELEVPPAAKDSKDIDNTDKGTPAENTDYQPTPAKDITHTSTHEIKEGNKKGTQTFSEVLKNKSYKARLMQLMKSKFKGTLPKKVTEWENFLRDKDIEVDSIGTTDKDIEAWIKTIENCRP